MAVKHHPYLRNSVYLLCHLLTATIRSSSIALTSAMQSVASGWQWQYGRPPGVRLRNCQCVDAGFIKHTPIVDGGLRCHVPTRPRCTTPHIRFLFVAPHLWIGLPPSPPRDGTLALLLTLGSTNTWYRDSHPTSYGLCPAHTRSSPAKGFKSTWLRI